MPLRLTIKIWLKHFGQWICRACLTLKYYRLHFLRCILYFLSLSFSEDLDLNWDKKYTILTLWSHRNWSQCRWELVRVSGAISQDIMRSHQLLSKKSVSWPFLMRSRQFKWDFTQSRSHLLEKLSPFYVKSKSENSLLS